MHPRAPLMLSILGLAVTAYAGWLGLADMSCLERGATVMVGSLALLSIAGVADNRLRLQRGVTITLLLMMTGLLASRFLGNELLATNLMHDERYATFLIALLTLNVVGLVRGSFLARWLSLALAGGGIVSGGLNLVPFATQQSQYTWTLAIGVAGSLLILANLLGHKQREHFEKNASPLWSSQDPLLKSVRWTIIAFMAAVPMLLVYTWMQPIVPETAQTALPLAIFLSLSIIASAKRWVIGALGLVLGGMALIAQAATTYAFAAQMPHPAYAEIALYYAIFWVPAGMAALICGARMAAPIFRLLKER
tara:strand:- start:139241 stop:140164 length:924 start_codon:yes stop_codon:yes gene_type:complete